jgi:hypothetical protein
MQKQHGRKSLVVLTVGGFPGGGQRGGENRPDGRKVLEKSPARPAGAARAGRLTQDGSRPGFRHSHAFGMDILGERIIANALIDK